MKLNNGLKVFSDMRMSALPHTAMLSEGIQEITKIASSFNSPGYQIRRQYDEMMGGSLLLKHNAMLREFILPKPQALIVAEALQSSLSKLSAYEYQFDDEDNREEQVEVVDYSKRIITDIYSNQDLLNTIDPRHFEEMIAELLHFKGFHVELTQRTRDNGYDILALTYMGGFPFKILVECKRHKNTIGIEVVRSFLNVIDHEKANKGLIVTSSYFSSGCYNRQKQEGHILDLRDRDAILNWVADYSRNKLKLC